MNGKSQTCPKCMIEWEPDCEQSISVSLYGHCIVS